MVQEHHYREMSICDALAYCDDSPYHTLGENVPECIKRFRNPSRSFSKLRICLCMSVEDKGRIGDYHRSFALSIAGEGRSSRQPRTRCDILQPGPAVRVSMRSLNNEFGDVLTVLHLASLQSTGH